MEKILWEGLWNLFFIIMRYTSIVGMIICICSTVLLAENGAAQTIHDTRISLHVKNKPLMDVLENIERSTNFRFVYTPGTIDIQAKVSVSADDATVAEILKTVLSRNNTGSRMRIRQIRRNIVLFAEPIPLTGSIEGVVRDEKTGDPLPGANIRIEETGQGASADKNGKFKITRINPGTYSVTVSFISYQSKRLDNVSVTADNASVISVSLATASSNLEEVVVRSEVDVRFTPIERSTEQSLISDMRLSNNIVTGISNDQIARSLDRDAADVMRRVPGVTVLNNFVLIRGLDPRYNVTYLNGMLTPSTESDSRAFAFNLIPSGLIDDIKVYKLPAPELPAGFGGGVIKVSTPRNQVARRFEVSASAQYRTGGASMADHYTGSSQSSKDVWGWGANDRRMPAQFYDKNYKLARMDFYPGERMADIRSMPAPNNLVKDHHGLDRRFSLNYYDSYKLGTVRVNNLLSLGYTYQRDFNRNHVREQWVLGDYEEYDGMKLPNILNQAIDSVYTKEVRLSLLESMGIIFNENHRIDVNVFANRSATDNVFFNGSADDDFTPEPLIPGRPAPNRELSFEYRVRDLISAQISGEHTMGRHHIGWRFGQVRMKEFIPDFQKTTYSREVGSTTYTVGIPIGQTDDSPRQYYNTEDLNNLAGLDYSFDLNKFLTIKSGALLQWNSRTFENMVYITTQRQPNFVAPEVKDRSMNVYQPWYKLTDVFADENYREDNLGFNMMSTFSALSYGYDQRITSVYIAPLIKLLSNKLEIYGGVRYENEFTDLLDPNGKPLREEPRNINNPNPAPGQPNYTTIMVDLPGPDYQYFLPSANVTWNITEKQKLRAGYGRTLDRPAFRERSRSRFYNTRDGRNYEGNFDLVNAELDNYDLRWELYPSETEFLSLGVFYKSIDNPIEVVEYGMPSWARLSRKWYNKAHADLTGIEIEARKNLAFTGLPLADRFSVIANAAFVHTVLDDVLVLKEGDSPDVRLYRATRPLSGSSPYIVNVSMYYEAPRSKTIVTLAYNEIGPRIIATAPAYIGNLHEGTQRLFDLVITQPIGKYLKAKAGVQNLFNQDVVRWRDGNYDGKYNPGEFKAIEEGGSPKTDYESERWNQGAYYSLGLTLTF